MELIDTDKHAGPHGAAHAAAGRRDGGARPSRVAAAVALILGSAPYLARSADAPAATDSELDEVIVTGTRQTNLSAAESPTPIQILSAKELQTVAGNTDLMKALATVIPSLTSQPFGNGGSNHTLMVKLKGLSPNHALILINGKRRHTTANLAVNGSAYQGGAGADLNFIPMSAIDHVEVLTDGAAAQYGSDAIAGVINIILKKDASGGSASASYGANFDSGKGASSLPFNSNGGTTAFSFNKGFQLGASGYFNVTAETRNHNHTFQGDADARTVASSAQATYPNSNLSNAPGYPYLNWIQGDAAYHSKIASYNSGFDFGGGTEFYSFGTYGLKDADSYQNYRQPSVAKYTDSSTGEVTYLYPYGFEPREAVEEIDYASTVGLKGIMAGWNWDLASTWGRDRHDIYTLDSVNTTLYSTTGSSPTDFYDGSLIATQWTTNLDVSHDFDVGLAGPMNTALGVEYRRDTYEILAGIPQSYQSGGAAANAGYSTDDAAVHSRDNAAFYVDLGGLATQKLRLDVAGRFEHFSDFGNKTVGKLTGRYDFVPEFAMRGTVSTGFRAPTLAEEYYSAISVGPSSISAQLPPNGSAAALLGLGKLKPERSTNLSLGFVFRPIPSMSATLDLYRIRVADRIVGSSTLYGTSSGVVISQLVNDVLNAAGVDTSGASVTSTGINVFTNGIDTKTDGADLMVQFPVQYSFGHVDWSVGATYNKTDVTYVKPLSADLVAALRGSPVYSLGTIGNLTTASPRYVVNLGALWNVGNFTLNVLEKLYGPSSSWGSTTSNATATRIWYENKIGATPITNVDLSYQMTDSLKMTLGANNLFNRFPSKLNSELLAAANSSYAVTRNDSTSASPYPLFSPFGINGGSYYLRATYTF